MQVFDPTVKRLASRIVQIGSYERDTLMRTWLARLAFSFIVLAAALAWTAYRTSQERPGAWTIVAMYCAAALLLGIGLAGMRERHR